MQTKTYLLLDEKDLLDLICKENKLERSSASMNINYVEGDHNQVGSWTIQVQANPKNEHDFRNIPDQLKTNEFNPER